LYLNGILSVSNLQDEGKKEMTLEVRLNVASFYQRLAHYAFTNDCLEAWATNLIDEILYYQQTDKLVSKLGLSNFHCVMPFSDHRFEWSEPDDSPIL
jgi:hypothetical protein